MQPAYGLARLPGDARERFMLDHAVHAARAARTSSATSPARSTPAGARSSPLLSLPRDRLTVGPTQATRRILSSPGRGAAARSCSTASRATSASPAVSRTVLGVPRVVPIAGTLVHVQPLYLTAGGERRARGSSS